jgi:hypothetical protein
VFDDAASWALVRSAALSSALQQHHLQVGRVAYVTHALGRLTNTTSVQPWPLACSAYNTACSAVSPAPLQ